MTPAMKLNFWSIFIKRYYLGLPNQAQIQNTIMNTYSTTYIKINI